MGSLHYTVGMRVVSGYSNVFYVVVLLQVCECFEECRAIVGYKLALAINDVV